MTRTPPFKLCLRARWPYCALVIAFSLANIPGALSQTVPEERVEPSAEVKPRKTPLAGAPTGAGITVAQVEAYYRGGYMAFSGQSDAEFAGKRMVAASPVPPGVSPHARTVGAYCFGNTHGIAPGIADVVAFDVNDYLERILQWNSASPEISNFDLGAVRIVNNSWVYDGVGPNAVRALRRSDYQADQFGVIFVNATHNNSYSNVPTLPASLYNGITVGRADTTSSHGPAFFDGGGRAKPDLVVDAYATSYAAPQVAGAAALLLEQVAAEPDAQRPAVIKAVLLTGAEKPGDWHKGDQPANDDELHPLDWRFGAGVLRLDRNAAILRAPRAAAMGAGAGAAWASDELTAGSEISYRVRLGGPSPFTATLCWNRHHSGDFSSDAVVPLSNLVLELWHTNAAGAPTALVQRSASLVDNVQHIHVEHLAPRNYILRIVHAGGDAAERFGLAWWSEGATLRGDMDGDGVVTAFDLDPLLLALFDRASYLAAFPQVDPDISGDTNYDGRLDFFDLDSFVALLIGGPA